MPTDQPDKEPDAEGDEVAKFTDELELGLMTRGEFIARATGFFGTPAFHQTRPVRVSSSLALAGSDALGLLTAFILAGLSAEWLNAIFLGRQIETFSGPGFGGRVVVYVTMSVALLFWFTARGHYRRRTSFFVEARDVLVGIVTVGLIDGFAQFALKDEYSRLWLMQSWALSALFITSARYVIKKSMIAAGHWTIPTLIIGDGESALAAEQALTADKYLGYTIVDRTPMERFLDTPKNNNAQDTQDTSEAPESNVSRMSRMREIMNEVWGHHGARFFVIAPEPEDLLRMEGLIRTLNFCHVPFAVSPPLRGMVLFGLDVHHVVGHDQIFLFQRNNLARPLPRLVKRSFDLVTASLGLLVLSPILLVISAIIMLDGGSPIYSSPRIGRNGQIFYCLKFRTMVKNAEQVLTDMLDRDPTAREQWNKDFKLENDPRITAIGRLLRESSLDELPQLLNVVRGEMSLVGPRPLLLDEREVYGDDFEVYALVAPGITGLWQVSGRNDISYKRRVELNNWYVRNWSLWHDIAILLKTVGVILKREGVS